MLLTMSKRPQRQYHLQWVFSAFDEHPTFATKRMFGGLAAYCHGRMVMVLMEDPDEYSYRGVEYAYPIWDGILLPTEREFHPSLLDEFPDLDNHPVLPKWLYLPQVTENFERLAEKLADRIVANDERFGIYPKPPRVRKKKVKKKKVSAKKKTSQKAKRVTRK